MSRCFPFPPPGYVWKVGGESLVELLKLRREGALACKKKMKKQQISSRKVKEKSSDERKRFKCRKTAKVDYERSDMSKERKCEATTWQSEIRRLSEELEWPTSCNHMSNYRDYNQDINNLLQMDQFNGDQMPFDYAVKGCGDSFWDTGLIALNELCYSSSETGGSSQQQINDCALSSQSSRISQSEVESWDLPPTLEIEYDDVDDLNWLVKRSPKQTKAISDDHIHTPADKFTLYPSTRYLPEAGIYALPYTMVV